MVIIAYQIVKTPTTVGHLDLDFPTVVNAEIAEGWQPLGSPFVHTEPFIKVGDDNDYIAQAMVKYAPLQIAEGTLEMKEPEETSEKDILWFFVFELLKVLGSKRTDEDSMPFNEGRLIENVKKAFPTDEQLKAFAEKLASQV